MFTSAKGLYDAISPRRAETIVRDVLGHAGITVGGTQPHDIRVNDPSFYVRALRDGRLGVGESYMDGQWECDAVDACTDKMLRANLQERVKDWRTIAYVASARLLNRQSASRAFEVGEKHYDVGNDLYAAMLGPSMAYTCAYFQKDDFTLDQAQEAKFDLICRKVGLKSGMRVLELGCGWGGFAKFAATRYGVKITGYTVSKEQVAFGKKLCEGLPVDLRLEDYRQARGTYDAVISIGLMEHVGYKNYRTYMKVVDRCLKPDGVAFVHTIGSNYSMETMDTWFEKYIFPNALIPSLAQIDKSMEGLFIPEDVHNIGPHYDRTLMEWSRNFEAGWPSLKHAYNERFYRMWQYYLLSCAGSFRARFTQLYQIVMTRPSTSQPLCRLS